MKKYIELLGLVLVLILIVSLSISISTNIDLNNKNKSLKENIYNYGKDISDLTLENIDLENELEKKDSRIVKLDSILKENKSEIKKLKSAKITTVTIVNKDTNIIVNVDSLKQRELNGEKIYITPFYDDRNCIRIEGFVKSTDSVPAVAITSQHSTIEVYDVIVKRKWWQIFSPKEKRITYTKCGNLRVLTLK